jgi:hypothetical protein
LTARKVLKLESHHCFEQAAIRSTVSREGFGVVLSIFSYYRSDPQPERTILLGARNNFRVLGLSAKLC